MEENGREGGTAEGARRRVRSYFQQLRDQLCVQEVAALTVVDTHVRERVCSIRQQEEDIATALSQVAEVCIQCARVVRQDDARVLLAAPEIDQLLASVEQQQQQFAELTPDQLLPALDSAIPVTFTKDNRAHIGPKIEMRVVTLGLDEAGKTSILFKLKQNEFVPTIPTIGFNVETLEFKNVKITMWDVGGQQKLRPLWKHYYLNTQAVIFVIDASNRERLLVDPVEQAGRAPLRLHRGDHRPVLVVQALLWAIMARAGLRGEGRDRVAGRLGVALQAARGGRVAGPGLNILAPLSGGQSTS